MTTKLDAQALSDLYNEAARLDGELETFSDELFDFGLDETSTALGVRDAIRAIGRTISDLDRRITFAKEDESKDYLTR